MTGEQCSIPNCYAPVEGYCQICKKGFCNAHLITENIQTSDGRLQYVTVCPDCYNYVKAGKYKGLEDNLQVWKIMLLGLVLVAGIFFGFGLIFLSVI